MQLEWLKECITRQASAAATEQGSKAASAYCTERGSVLRSLASVIAGVASTAADVVSQAAKTLRTSKQQDARSLCRPWGVALTEKKDSGNFGRGRDSDIKHE